MSLRRRLANLCLVVLTDTLADLAGVLEEIRSETGGTRPLGGRRHKVAAPVRFRRTSRRGTRGARGVGPGSLAA